MFENKVVIVTGGANGIGKEIATTFSLKGARTIVCDIEEPRGMEPGITFVRADVSNEEEVKNLFKKVQEEFRKVDILINNAGISEFVPFQELTIERWDKVINTNLRSVFLCTKEAVNLMPKGSAIVNMASTRALMSEPNTESYSASKGGIVALTHALSMSLAEKEIRVNCISPGWIETNNYEGLRAIDHCQHPSRRVGKPADIAKACMYLCEPDNHFVNGTNLVVDGGMTRKMIYEE